MRQKKDERRACEESSSEEDMGEVSSKGEEESEVSSSEEEERYEGVGARRDSQKSKEKVDHRKRKTLIISTSITRDINPVQFNNCYEYGKAWFARKRGWKIRQIKEDVKQNLRSGDCDEVIIHMGGNDLQDMYAPDIINKRAVWTL